MIVTYFRSSSLGSHKICEMQYYLTYVLGLPAKAGKKASLGNVTHKALETLAWQGYHQKRGHATYEDETFGELEVAKITPEWAARSAYDHYKVVDDHIKWNDRYDLPTVIEWTIRATTEWGGLYDPRKLNVIEAEKRFDVTLDFDWAKFSYETPEGTVEGQLSLKGTVDLIVGDDDEPDYMHVIDWKTGQARDWSVADEQEARKDYWKLLKDQQLWLYHYALNKTYPHVKHAEFSIVFINDGGPYRLLFDEETLVKTEAMIREKFEAIKNQKYPTLNKGTPCFTWCSFGKRSQCDRDPSRTVCDFYAEEVRKKGADKVFYEIGDISKLMSYQDGGGRKAV